MVNEIEINNKIIKYFFKLNYSLSLHILKLSIGNNK